MVNDEEMVMERFGLVKERVIEISKAPGLKEPLDDYFRSVALFLKELFYVLDVVSDGGFDKLSLGELSELNRELYKDILPDNYGRSYGNPEYITHVFNDAGLPNEYAECLCFLYAEIRGMIPYAFEGRYDYLTMFSELFVEIYVMFSSADEQTGLLNENEAVNGVIQDVDAEDCGLITVPEAADILKTLCSFENDNCDLILTDRMLDQLDPSRTFAEKIIMESDLADLRYLYYYGEYVSDNELKTASFLNSLTQNEIDKMASTYTEGYRIGFVKAKKPLDKKETVNIRFPLGFERMVRSAITQFSEMGLKPTIYRAATLSLNKNIHHRIGYVSTSPNRQYDYDHQDDRALFFDSEHAARRLKIQENAYEKYKTLANVHAGPACIETFGENPFTPSACEQALKLSKKQQECAAKYAVQSGTLTNRYIIGEERSFTIIAYPVPEIGDKFEEIFKQTVKLNTLDYKLYESMQQILIDTLDKAQRVHIVGKDGNETDLYVELYELKDPEHETKFENCVADVNIPVGEVFTSPVLKGTTGLLHVKSVYLEGLLYKNLKVHLKDGCVEKYSCANFQSVKDNEKYFKENVLFNHETLPLGEFAIGTNTTAYRMARDYGIEERLPILIGEKTGPHFALGDTCYSREEDVRVYNPDGKEIISKENDFSRMRFDDPNKAYFSCHTDITIPYDELGGIYAMTEDGIIPIIEDGKFVLKGCEELNTPLETNH